MARSKAVILALLSVACNRWSPTEATSPQETFVIAETARFSGIAGQRVRGEISTTLYEVKCPDGSPCHAFGWYVGDYGKGAKGVAYYYRPDVNKADSFTLSKTAAHEVCHSITGPDHDQKHSDCTKNLYETT